MFLDFKNSRAHTPAGFTTRPRGRRPAGRPCGAAPPARTPTWRSRRIVPALVAWRYCDPRRTLIALGKILHTVINDDYYLLFREARMSFLAMEISTWHVIPFSASNASKYAHPNSIKFHRNAYSKFFTNLQGVVRDCFTKNIPGQNEAHILKGLLRKEARFDRSSSRFFLKVRRPDRSSRMRFSCENEMLNFELCYSVQIL